MLNQITKQWPSILEILELETSTVSFQTWFKNLKPIDVRDNILLIETIDDFSKDILKNRYTVLSKMLLFKSPIMNLKFK